MIRHLAEVWLLLAATFLVGSLLGALLYRGLALGPLAVAQGALADAIGDAVDSIRTGLGLGSEWRPYVPPAAKRRASAPAIPADPPPRKKPVQEAPRKPVHEAPRKAPAPQRERPALQKPRDEPARRPVAPVVPDEPPLPSFLAPEWESPEPPVARVEDRKWARLPPVVSAPAAAEFGQPEPRVDDRSEAESEPLSQPIPNRGPRPNSPPNPNSRRSRNPNSCPNLNLNSSRRRKRNSRTAACCGTCGDAPGGAVGAAERRTRQPPAHPRHRPAERGAAQQPRHLPLRPDRRLDAGRGALGRGPYGLSRADRARRLGRPGDDPRERRRTAAATPRRRREEPTDRGHLRKARAASRRAAFARRRGRRRAAAVGIDASGGGAVPRRA